MAVDMFLKFDPIIEGESRDKAHEGDIDILAWSWGVNNPGKMGGLGRGMGAGKATFESISFVSYFEKSTTSLLLSCAAGTHFTKSTLYCRKAGNKPQVYLTIELITCTVSLVEMNASLNDERQTVSFRLNFGAVQVEYKVQDSRGNVAGTTRFGWDVAAHTEI